VHNPDDDYDVLWDDENDPIKNVVHTSIFSVCHSIKAEAMDVLYGTKILRGNALDMDIALDNKDVFDLVRYVEIKDCVYAYRQPGEARRLRAVLNESRCPTGLRSMIVLSDELSSSYAPISIMDFVADAGLGPATCVDVGRYQLEGAFKGVQIVNRQLQELWPDVRATLEDHDGLEDALASLRASIPQNMPTTYRLGRLIRPCAAGLTFSKNSSKCAIREIGRSCFTKHLLARMKNILTTSQHMFSWSTQLPAP
jgi:hypothetical protein